MLNRREAIGAAIGAAVSFILPAPRPRLDLLQFCGEDTWKYSLSLPWECQDHTYATDGRACVRVRPESADQVQRRGEMPPFGSLPWEHARLRGWRELPRLEPLLASDSECPVCDGRGYEGGVIASGCPHCDGTGHDWVGNGWDLSVPVKCKACAGRGYVLPPGAVVCCNCKGNAIGVFPSVVRLGDGAYFDAKLYGRVRRLGGDYVLTPDRGASGPLLQFRFDGGEGLFLGHDRAAVERRLEQAAMFLAKE